MEHFECDGAPRDMGADQGRFCGDRLREDLGLLCAWPTRLRHASQRRALRDLQRYYPHQHEQLTGMARAAGVSVSRLARASLAALHAPARAVGYRQGGSAKLAASAPIDALHRDTRAEGRFAARELTRPVLTTALLAVNEAGLAAAVAGVSMPGDCAAPGALLVRDCVERFETVAAASEWCLTRPCAPGTTLLLADAAGELAAVAVGAGDRRVLSPVDEVVLPSALAVHRAPLSKALEMPDALDRLLRRHLGDFVVALPQSRSLAGNGRTL